MCRSIKTLRPPFVDDATHDDVHAAAFDEAVAAVSRATAHLLDQLEVRGARAR